MTLADPGLAAARAAAEALVEGPIDSIERAVTLGRNSNIFSVRQGALRYALKRYPSAAEDQRNRLETELGALELMTRHGIRNVPRPVAGDAARGYALLEWIDGESLVTPMASDVDAAIGFLTAVDCLRVVEEARLQPLASEACLSGAEVVAQIERRLSRLDAISKSESALRSLIEEELRPLLAVFAADAEAGYATAKMEFATAISPENRTLCPSDFGFHNSLRTPDKTLCFIDFDYFGWDDPVKLVADFLLHPGMSLSDALKRQFFAGASNLYCRDTEFGVRFRLLFPLFGLRWCMILLNEFLPERWSIRHRVGEQSNWGEVKRRQLARVCQFVQMLKTEPAFFP